MERSDSNQVATEKDEINKKFIKAVLDGMSRRHFEFAKKFLEDNNDVDVNVACDEEGDTALMYAIRGKLCEKECAAPFFSKNYWIDIVELLIKKGANINIQDEDLLTPLMHASMFKDPEMSQLLLSQESIKIDVNDDFGYNALLCAASKDRHHFIPALLKAGADINAVDNEGNSALTIATKNFKKNNDKFINTAKVLIQNEAKVNLANEKGAAPLIYSLMYEKLDIALMLLEKGADVNVANKKGVTAKILIKNLDKQFGDPNFEKEEDTNKNIEFLGKINAFIDKTSESVKAEPTDSEVIEASSADNALTENLQINSDEKDTNTAHSSEINNDDVSALGDGITEINLASDNIL